MRFIGSKEKLLSFIDSVLSCQVGKGDYVAGDLFCGTAAVSRLFKQLGYRVVANDNLKFCCVLAHAVLGINDEPSYESLVKFGGIAITAKSSLFSTSYDHVLHYLNGLPGEPGFIFSEYSPGGTKNKQFQRLYFSDENAQKIDAIRAKIHNWQNASLLTQEESHLLISELMRAANRVANISGTYGCFNKLWDPRAKKQLTLQRSPIISSPYQHEVLSKDANELVKDRYFDILYLDPPYTWRHYGAYYHLLETIAEGDKPVVTGKTGLRPWEKDKSRYCDRSDAANALQELISSMKCRHFLLSYNSEGLITHDQLIDIISLVGEPICYEKSYRRYKSNNGGTGNNSVKERLYYVRVK